ncbi:restriction endonuclease subunit S [Mediterraneibacter sp. HCN-7094]
MAIQMVILLIRDTLRSVDNLHYEKFSDGTIKCIEDEIPFDVPNNWEWVRIKTACVINPRNNIDDDTEVSFVPMANIKEGYANKFISDVRIWKKIKTGYTHFAENDIGVAKITPCFENKKSVVFNGLINGYGAGTTELYIVRAISGLVIPEYLLNFFKRDDFIAGGVLTFSGDVGQQRVTKDYVANYLFTLPPLNEQQRILNAVHNVNSLIESIENSKDNLKVDINRTKAKILDLAIRGKLIPQNPDDEPASVLLERIRAEKEEIIKQGKIKRNKKESVIFKGDDNSYYEKIENDVTCIDNEIPFEIPDNWSWARISNIADITMGSSPKSQDICNNNQYVEFHQGKIYFSKKRLMKSNQYTKKITKIAAKQSVLLCVRAPVGELNITDRKICIGRGLASIKPLGNINEEFMFYWLHPYKTYLVNRSTGSTFSAITSDTVRNILIPVPPQIEQKQILNKIQKAFSWFEKLETVN